MTYLVMDFIYKLDSISFIRQNEYIYMIDFMYQYVPGNQEIILFLLLDVRFGSK